MLREDTNTNVFRAKKCIIQLIHELSGVSLHSFFLFFLHFFLFIAVVQPKQYFLLP